LPDLEGDRTVRLVTSPTRNFTLTVEERIRALTIGTPAYLVHGRRWMPEEPFTSSRLLDLARAILARRGA
jgi:hypothetical protein